MIRKWDFADEQEKKLCFESVLTRLEEQGDAPFGHIATQDLVDIVAMHLGPQIYNAALEDIRKVLQIKLADLETDIDLHRVSS